MYQVAILIKQEFLKVPEHVAGLFRQQAVFRQRFLKGADGVCTRLRLSRDQLLIATYSGDPRKTVSGVSKAGRVA